MWKIVCLLMVLSQSQINAQSNVGNINCRQYQAGVCIACNYGLVPLGPDHFCIPCGPGDWFVSNACTPCAAGRWSNATGLTSGQQCNLCSEGTYSPVWGATLPDTCVSCPAVTDSGVALLAPAGSAFCTACNILLPGCTNCSSPTACSACALGFALNPATQTCTPCNSGTFNAELGATVCTNCPTGTYTDIGQLGYSDCLPCPQNSHPVAGAAQTSLAYCGIATCLNTQVVNGKSTCVAPAPGYVVVSGLLHLCSSELPNCEQCRSTGLSIAQKPVTCTQCAANTSASLQSISAYPSFNMCCLQNCTALNRTNCAANGLCTNGCATGYYPVPAINEYGSQCIACPANTYNAVAAATSIANCLPCPQGTISPAGSKLLSQCVAI